MQIVFVFSFQLFIHMDMVIFAVNRRGEKGSNATFPLLDTI